MPSWPRKGVSEVTSRLDPFSLTPTLPSVYALLSLVSSHHDTLISRRLSPKLSLPPHPFVTPPPPSADAPAQPPLSRTSPLLAPPSEHARYTRYWTERSGVYRKASRTLATLGYVELLVEMLARRRGDRVRWRLVLLIEPTAGWRTKSSVTQYSY
jgi:peroxin-16